MLGHFSFRYHSFITRTSRLAVCLALLFAVACFAQSAVQSAQPQSVSQNQPQVQPATNQQSAQSQSVSQSQPAVQNPQQSATNQPASQNSKGGVKYYELPEVKAPWMKGERLSFDLCWGPITAGTATLEVKPTKDGKTEFYTLAHDNGALKKIYPVADTIYTRVRNKGLMTEVFRKTLHEGSFHNKSVIRFDRRGEKAWLSDTVFKDPYRKHVVKRSADTAVAIQGLEHSIMSAFYLVRTMPLTVGDTSRFSAVSGKERYELKVLVHGREKIKTVIGEKDCIKVEPVLDGDGIFVSKGRIFIWLTDDLWRIPVLMKCEIALGSVKAVLTSTR